MHPVEQPVVGVIGMDGKHAESDLEPKCAKFGALEPLLGGTVTDSTTSIPSDLLISGMGFGRRGERVSL